MTETNDIATILADSPLLADVNQEAIEAIAGIAHESVLPPATTIIQFGDPGNNCYVIVSGKVREFRTSKAGVEHEFIQLGPGESFGETALLTGEPMVVSVETTEETRLIVIPRDPFDLIMKKYPDVTTALSKMISHKLFRVSSTMEEQVDRQFETTRMSWADFALILGLSVLCALAFNLSNSKGIPLIPKNFSDEAVSFIAPSVAFKQQRSGKALLVDAMPSNFYEQEHIAGAVSLPLAIFDFMYDMSLGQTDKSKEIIVYGRTISKHYDEEVASKLVARGHKNVTILKGGISLWKKGHYPVEP